MTPDELDQELAEAIQDLAVAADRIARADNRLAHVRAALVLLDHDPLAEVELERAARPLVEP